jgi:hypothetical protein
MAEEKKGKRNKDLSGISLCVDHQMGSFGGKLQAILNFTADSYILCGVSSEISPFLFGN